MQDRFSLPCGHGLQSAQFLFSLPCEHRFAPMTHDRFPGHRTLHAPHFKCGACEEKQREKS